MATVALQVFTAPYPSIPTDSIQMRVYDQADDQAVLAAITHAAPHTATETWSFAGLPRVNLVFRVFEMNGSTQVRQLGGDMNVIPGSASGFRYRAPEQFEIGVTPGTTAGISTFTFDGTNGAPDWRGFDIGTINRIGTGPMRPTLDYEYDPNTGIFNLEEPGDVFGDKEFFNVDFVLEATDQTDSVSTDIKLFTLPKIITDAGGTVYNIDAGEDMESILIFRPAGVYMEGTLPALSTVVAGRVVMIEHARSATMKSVKINARGTDYIDWSTGNLAYLFINPSESIGFYKFVDSTSGSPVSMWRVFNPFGNFLRVGDEVYNAMTIPANSPGMQPMNGAILSVIQYSRLYDYVTKLPAGQAVALANWATGNNKYFFSLQSGGNFHVPDHRESYNRYTDAYVPGTFIDQQVGQFNLTLSLPTISKAGSSNIVPVPGIGNDQNRGNVSVDMGTANAGKENLVKSVISKKYLIL